MGQKEEDRRWERWERMIRAIAALVRAAAPIVKYLLPPHLRG